MQADDDVPSFQQLVEHAEALQHDVEQAEHDRGTADDERDPYDDAVIDFVKRTGCGYFHIVVGPGSRHYFRDSFLDPNICVQGDCDDREIRIDEPATGDRSS